MHHELGEDVVFLAVAAGDDDELIQDFVAQTGIAFPVVYDEGTLLSQIDFPSHLSPYPRQVVIDADGILVYVASEHHSSDLRAAIDGALAR